MSELSQYKQSLNQDDIQIDNDEVFDFSRSEILHKHSTVHYRFYRIAEISSGKAEQYRLAMANVISTLHDNHNAIVYLLSGAPGGIRLYLGVAGTNAASCIDEAEMLRHAFEGNFLGAQLQQVNTDSHELQDLFRHSKHWGLITGVPSFNEEEANLDGQDFQGIERLTNTLIDSRWQMVIVAEAGTDEEIRHSLREVYDLSTRISSQIKHSIQQSENTGWNTGDTKGTSDSETKGTSRGESKGTSSGSSTSKGSSASGSRTSNSSGISSNTGVSDSIQTGSSHSTQTGNSYSRTEGQSGGNSLSLTREHINKRKEQIQEHLGETQIKRFRQGYSKGMYRTAIYVCADNKSTYTRLANGVLSIFQGSQLSYTPLRVHKLPIDGTIQLNHLLRIRSLNMPQIESKTADAAVIHSIPQQSAYNVAAATWLTTRELSLLAGLPGLELPGLKLRKSVSFALNTVEDSQGRNIGLGRIIQDGRRLEGTAVTLPQNALNKHVFVTGVTGSGKTTTCMKLLLESGLPFTVIEPAKTEYRALHQQLPGAGVEYYCLGREDLSTFRLNPFELVSPRQNLTGHISMLKATLCAVFPMEASMPFIVEQAIMQAYQEKGWDIANNTNYLYDNPWDVEADAWPTFGDMIAQLEKVIKSAGMGKEFEEKYQGSLVSRLSSLTHGLKGTMINTPRSIDFDALLDKKVVIELEELKDEEDKAFFMGLIIGRFAECMKQRHQRQPDFQHITLVEEAHRLLSQPEPGADGSKKLGVDMFANLLAEVRKYGECLVIADQIPNKLVADVIKNTNTKIIHRLFAADDRRSIGDAMGLNDEQKDFLPMLQAGETVIYSGGWHAAVRAQIDQLANTTAQEISEDLIRKQGVKQLWDNRRQLLPRFSRHPELNADNLAPLFQAAREQLNMLITLAQRHPDKPQGATTAVTDLSPQLHQIAGRWAAKVSTTIAGGPFDLDTWCALWLDLLADCHADSTIIKSDDLDLLQNNHCLANMVQAAQQSSSQLFELVRSGVVKKAFFAVLAKCHLI